VIGGDDARPWLMVGDGTIVGLERDLHDTVAVTIQHLWMRGRFADGGIAFVFWLRDCRDIIYQPMDEPGITELAAIAASEPDIVTARHERHAMRVVGRAGELVLRYASLRIELDTGRALTLDELDAAQRLRP
jgi:hypothetical protein